MNYLPKKKSDIQLNGVLEFDVSWKKSGNIEVQKEFDERFDEIKKKFEELQEEYYWNNLVYESEIKFNPVVGKVYHLYDKGNGHRFLSLIAPNEWDIPYIGSFNLKYNRKWEKV